MSQLIGVVVWNQWGLHCLLLRALTGYKFLFILHLQACMNSGDPNMEPFYNGRYSDYHLNYGPNSHVISLTIFNPSCTSTKETP